jgi:hypothetical protein
VNVVPPRPTSSRAVTALVLGILGIVFCPLAAPVAWAIGREAEQQIDASGGALDGRGLATAGKITGIIGAVMLVLYVLAFVLFFVVLAYFAKVDSTTFTTETVPR